MDDLFSYYNDFGGICSITHEVKPYKNLFIFIISHPLNNSSVTAELLSRMNFIDRMTRDVDIVMPGYKRASEGDVVVNADDRRLQLTFDEDSFIGVIQDLEDKSYGRYQYKDNCELLFIGNSDSSYDFDHLVRLDLLELQKTSHIDPIQLIINVSNKFRGEKKDFIDMDKSIKSIIDGMSKHQEPSLALKVFIAGSKSLNKECSLLREELSKIENIFNVDIRALTFEDFATSLTGKDKGRQADYNSFIQNDANIVVFVFDSTAGKITKEEFDIAYDSLQGNKKPKIFVYVRKKHLFFFYLKIKCCET